ncbi:hypothetical protein DFH11DRAFT_141170 [Phellopilus nigrolimitatus]|nr:hypothetical protein DFH11DRAFT_141170 [Phellopilus nigrolimitatus]
MPLDSCHIALGSRKTKQNLVSSMSFSRQHSGTSIPTFNSRRGSSTSFSISTNQTASNLPGAGRTMGLLFDVAGRPIEQYANDIAARIIGTQDHLTLSAVTHAASSSRTSLSTNATASNLPGAGRTLGLAYDRGGGVLEVLLNRLAKQLGRGPDASMERIQERLFSMISAEDGAVPYVLELLRQKSFFIKECKRILRYAQNDISSNQCAAFRSIISLCVDDSFLRILFNSLGAADVIQGMEPRIACAHADERDPLLSCSQKALISLAEVEVNTIAQKLHFLDAFMKTDVAREASFVLLRQFSSSQISFLALRHSDGSLQSTAASLRVELPRRRVF